MTLTEIIEEGKKLEAAFKSTPSPLYVQIVAGDKLSLFYVAHGPRLLAVAEAAVVLRNAMGTDWPLSLRDEIAAFDAAAGEVPR